MHLLDGSLNDKQKEALSYSLRDLQGKSIDRDFCEALIKKMIPLIELLSSPTDYKAIIDCFPKRKKELITKILPEIETLLAELQPNVSQNSFFLDDPIINSVHGNLQTIFQLAPEDKKLWVSIQYKVAVEWLKLLCDRIAVLGGKILVQDYVELFSEILELEATSFIYQCSYCIRRIKFELCSTDIMMQFCPDLECCGEIQSIPVDKFRKVTKVGLFNTKTFVPSYFKLCDLEDTFRNSAAGAWDRICAVKRAWPKKNRDYFRRKTINFDSPKRAAKSMFLLTITAYYLDVKKIKNSSSRTFSLVQCNRLFKDVAQVVDEQFKFNFYQNTLSKYINGPEAVELKIEDKSLRLIVTWSEGLYGVYELQLFHDDPLSCRGEFMRNLLDNPGMEISCREASGGNAAKYLKDAKITDILDQLFIDKKKGYNATLHSTRVSMEGQDIDALQSLQDYFKTLKFVEWRKKFTDGPLGWRNLTQN